MHGGSVSWLTTGLVGVTAAAPTGLAWRHVRVAPQIPWTAPQQGLATAAARVPTVLGLVNASWELPTAVAASVSTPIDDIEGGTTVAMDCAQQQGGRVVVDSVHVGAVNSSEAQSLRAATATCVQQELRTRCIGRASCRVSHAVLRHACPALGAQDAELARWAPRAACSVGWGVRLNASIPVGANGTVAVPLPPGVAAANATVIDGIAAAPVWKGGKYVPGVVGVRSATAGTGGAGGVAVVVEVASGAYSFTVQ